MTTKRRGICPVCDREYEDGQLSKEHVSVVDLLERIRAAGDLSKRSYGVLLSPTQALALNYVPAELVDAAEERGYRRAVQALRDEADRQLGFNDELRVAYQAGAHLLESLAAAPRNEGAQT